MKGAGGLGKTYELRFLADVERAAAVDVKFHRLALYAGTTLELRTWLDRLASRATAETLLCLDALDEAMAREPMAGQALAEWIRDLPEISPRIWVTCRSAVFPREVATAMTGRFADDLLQVSLEPLSTEDIAAIASHRGADPDRFLHAIRSARAESLAQEPMMLDMLLDLFQGDDSLPSSRAELFEKAVEKFSIEREERRTVGTAGKLDSKQVQAAAETLACIIVLSGRETIDLSDAPAVGSLRLAELEPLAIGQPPLTDGVLRAISSSQLCDGDGQMRFWLKHRRFAEYLAGRRLSTLLPHQAKAILGSALGAEYGVAGPLRETAAFAASLNKGIADWVVTTDPEVIGLSDLANEGLRRRALLGLLEMCRKHKLTDMQVSYSDVEYSGFHFAGVEDVLRPVLKSERGSEAEDVLACVLALIRTWRLKALSEELADFVLDPTVPLSLRINAGYVMRELGSKRARKRLLPLATMTNPGREELDLKGIALSCVWPSHLSGPELLKTLDPPGERFRVGAYDGFFHTLDRANYRADGHRVEGLRWARKFSHLHGNMSASWRTIQRIAHAALHELSDPRVATGLADLLLDRAVNHQNSPLEPIEGSRRSAAGKAVDDPFSSVPDTVLARRLLIDAVVHQAKDDHDPCSVRNENPGLESVDDFEWLFARALDPGRPDVERRRFALWARTMQWYGTQPATDLWLSHRDEEPIRSVFDLPTECPWGNAEAEKARTLFYSFRTKRAPKKEKLDPPPEACLQRALERCEEDVLYFGQVCEALVLKPDSRYIKLERFVTRTSGWKKADQHTRNKIVEAAKRLLTAESSEPERATSEPSGTIFVSYLPALWLVLEQDPGWVGSLSDQWWGRWAPYMLEQLHPGLTDESRTPKLDMAELIHARASSAVRTYLMELGGRTCAESQGLYTSLLGLFIGIKDPELDRRICATIRVRRIPPDRVAEAARFVLKRRPRDGVPACLASLRPDDPAEPKALGVQMAGALLVHAPKKTWRAVEPYLRHDTARARHVLGHAAHAERFRVGRKEAKSWAFEFPVSHQRELMEILIAAFPYEDDPVRDGAYFSGPDDAGRELRRLVLGALEDAGTRASIEELQTLERRFGGRYAWLRRPRSRAERAFLAKNWNPMEPTTTAEVLSAGRRRVIRSNSDVLDGIVEAIREFEAGLLGTGCVVVDDLWNTPAKGMPSPKPEENISKKLQGAIQRYFQDHAVLVDAEVRIRHSVLGKRAGGAPGSRVDVFLRPTSTKSDQAFESCVPIEVKRSCNEQAKTSLISQLANRYLKELRVVSGVYVVVWLEAPKLASHHRPVWKTRRDAELDLEQQAATWKRSSSGTQRVATIVLDASLGATVRGGGRRARKVERASKQRASRAKKGPRPPRAPPRNRKRSRRG
jgi:hypothetical protein